LLTERPFVDLLTLMAPSDAWPRPGINGSLDSFASRTATAIIALFGHTRFTLTDERFSQLAGSRSLIQHLLGAAVQKNADYVARRFLPVIAEDGTVQLPVRIRQDGSGFHATRNRACRWIILRAFARMPCPR